VGRRTVESLRAEQPEVDADPPVVGSGGAASGDDAAGTPIAESTDDKLNAIAADFDRDAPVDREFSDSDTDTFARVEPADESGVPLQQRTGLRAFADRAMGR